MKLVRFRHAGAIGFGRLADDDVELLAGDMFSGHQPAGPRLALDEIELLAPVVPSKIVAVGLNYRDHAVELGMDIPAEPILFLKPPSALLGPGGTIVYPPQSSQVDYEAELAIVIGRRAKNISGAEAKRHILGYTCANDITARDLQKRDGQWARAKSFDTFCPIGPNIVTGIDPDNLTVKLFQNGAIRQNSSTSQMIFSASELIRFISRVMTLLPGDVVLTGTPPGVGRVEVGDQLKVEIEGIGGLINTVGGDGHQSQGPDSGRPRDNEKRPLLDF